MSRVRLLSGLLVCSCVIASGCKPDAKDDEVASAKKADTEKAAESGEAPAPSETADSGQAAADSGSVGTTGAAPDPATVEDTTSRGGSGGGAGSGGAGSGGVAPAPPREDLTCDPTDDAACLEGEICVGAQGCDATWSCDAQIDCKKGVTEYCGCDGRTFEAVYGNCPWQKYAYPGPCK